ncbi:hypothetical protein ACFL6R_00635 [Gemmatimonadota bacterium]
MLRKTMTTIGAIALIAGMTTCTTGPQVQKPIDGTYTGAMTGAPEVAITFVANNGTLTGTGDIKLSDSFFRGGSEEHDLIITGTYQNAQITAMSATISFEYDSTPDTATPSTWVPATGQLNFQGEFTKNAAANGPFAGTTSVPNLDLGGSWIATKETLGAGILRP